VKLKDSIVSALRFFKAKETEIAWIDAMLDTSQARADIGELIHKFLYRRESTVFCICQALIFSRLHCAAHGFEFVMSEVPT
jgi:hypothetical protein